MNAAFDLVRSPAAQALAWTLVHFVWQGAALGLVAALALRVWRPADAGTRYTIGVAVLGAMLLVPVLTFTALIADAPPAAVSAPVRSAAAPPVRSFAAVTGEVLAETPANPLAVRALVPAAPPPPASGPTLRPASLLLILAGWLLGVAVLSVRLFGGWLVARRLARRGVTPAPDALARMAAAVAGRLAVARRVALAVSPSVTVPTVVGWIRPVVVLPLSALSELSPAQVEAILAHELAHVRRHDYAVNLLQAGIETLFFYHPCVWWVSAEVRTEREHCCDDLAVEACGDRLVYVSALADLAASSAPHTLALAATDGSLVARVRRILGRPARERHAAPIWAPFALVGLALVAAAVLNLTVASPADAGTDAVVGARAVAAVRPQAPASAPPVPVVAETAPRLAAPPAPGAERLPAMPASGPAGWPQAPAPPVPPAPPSPPAPPAPGSEPVFGVPPVPDLPPMPEMPPDPPDPPDMDPGPTGKGNMVWSTDSDRIALEWTGPFALSADDRDLIPSDVGTTVTLTEGRVLRTSMTFRKEADGTVTRTYRRNGRSRPVDADARAWLGAALRKAITHTGMFAGQRVARLLAAGGPDAVFAEIDRFGDDAGHAKRQYYEALVKQAEPTPALVTKVLDRLPKDITSDFELGRGLAAVMKRASLTDQQRVQVARAAAAIDSDFEHRRVLAAALASGPLTPELVAGVLDQARAIDSDFERARLLLDLIARGGVTERTSPAFVALAGAIDSSFERARVLAALAGSPDLARPVVVDGIRAASKIDSDFERRRALSAFLARADAGADAAVAVLAASDGRDGGYEQAQLLRTLVQKGGLTPATASAFFEAAGRITSSHERAGVLTAALGDGAAPGFIVSNVLRAVAALPGDYERAKLLVQIARTQTLDQAQRELFFAAADAISSRSEADRALAALARATRR